MSTRSAISLDLEEDDMQISTNDLAPQDKKQLEEYYIGALHPDAAEQVCKQTRKFRLYHRIEQPGPDVPLTLTLLLYIVHREPQGGKFCHFRVYGNRNDICISIPGHNKQFRSLNQLINYYEIHAPLNNKMDPFAEKTIADTSTSRMTDSWHRQ